jgi:hypothetical protein
MSANVQHIYLPSNDPSYPENRQNKFRCHLPVPVNCENGVWLVGLESIQFPHTWATIGTHAAQYVSIVLASGEAVDYPIPRGVFSSPAELQQAVNTALNNVNSNKRRRRSLDQNESIEPPTPEENESIGHEVKKEAPLPPPVNKLSKSAEPVNDEPPTPEEIQEEKKKENEYKAAEEKLSHASGHIPEIPTKDPVKGRESPEKIEPPTPEETAKVAKVEKEPVLPKKEETAKVAKVEKEPVKEPPKREETVIYAYGDPAHPVQAVQPAQPAQTSQSVGPQIAQSAAEVKKQKEEQRGVKRPSSLVPSGVHLLYLPDIGKFRFSISDSQTRHVLLSPQLGYALGFEKDQVIYDGDIAKYRFDPNGGVNHLCIYANGLSENMILGDTMASVLRIVTVAGRPGEVIERSFDPPIYHRVVSKSVNEIEIEIRDIEGNLIPFDYGVVLIGLQFKKAIYF